SMAVAAAVPVDAMGVAVGMFMGQQPVAIVLLGIGCAEVTALTDETGTEGEGICVVIGADLLVRRAGDLVFVGLALHAFSTHGKVAAARCKTKQACAFVGGTVGTQLQFTLIALLGYPSRHLAVDHRSEERRVGNE